VAEYLHAVIPRSQLVMLEVDGHLPHLSAPSLVVEAIGPFLRT
jgi:sigma-B regulation protein RsbQ